MDIEIKFYIVFMYHETLFSIYFQPLKNVKKKKKQISAHGLYKMNLPLIGLASFSWSPWAPHLIMFLYFVIIKTICLSPKDF